MGSYIAEPMSRIKIRKFASWIRAQLGLSEEKYFPVVEILELVLPRLDENFVLEIEKIEKMKGRHGLTYPEKSLIILREDVYLNAVSGVPRDRFTVAHEIGHYFMHGPDRVSFARRNSKEKLPAYLEPEWQANTFAGELLAPPEIIKGLSIPEISEICGVSLEVARIQRDKV